MSELSGPRILCAGRKVAELAWLRAAAAELDAELEAAGDGEALLDHVAQQPPDVVVVDFETGLLDGLEVCRRLAQERLTAHLPVYLVARETGQERLDEALEAGAMGVFQPPVSRSEARLQLRNAARLKWSTDAARQTADEQARLETARHRLVRVALREVERLLGASARGLAALAGESAGDEAERRRYLRVVAGEVDTAESLARTLRAIRAIELGDRRFEPDPVRLADLLSGLVAEAAENRPERSLALSVAGDLTVIADAALVREAVAGLMGQLEARLAPDAAVHLRLLPDGDWARIEVSAEAGAPLRGPAGDSVLAALQLTLARMAAEAHGGSVAVLAGEAEGLALGLPPEPPAGVTWPPCSVSRRAPGAGESGTGAGAEAADIAAAPRELPAPPRPPRLMPPARG